MNSSHSGTALYVQSQASSKLNSFTQLHRKMNLSYLKFSWSSCDGHDQHDQVTVQTVISEKVTLSLKER